MERYKFPISWWERVSGFALPSHVVQRLRQFLGGESEGDIYFASVDWDFEDVVPWCELIARIAPSGTDGIGLYVRADLDELGPVDDPEQDVASLMLWEPRNEPRNRFVLVDTGTDVGNQHYILFKAGALRTIVELSNNARKVRGRYWLNGRTRASPRMLRTDEADYVFEAELVERIYKDAVGIFDEKVARRYGDLGLAPKRGILVYGPPGNGKTSLLRLVARRALENGINVFEIDLGASRREGLDELFREAVRRSPCIILIDDIDIYFKGRSEMLRPSHSGELMRLLDGVESDEGFALLATTNLPGALDRALLRPGRFDILVPLGVPDAGGALAALRRMLKLEVVFAAGIADLVHGMSFADLAEIARRYKWEFVWRAGTYGWEEGRFRACVSTFRSEREQPMGEQDEQHKENELVATFHDIELALDDDDDNQT